MSGRNYTGATIAVQGLDQLVRDFGKINVDLRREVQRELQAVAEIVAVQARADVAAGGLVKSGRLQKGIRSRVRGATAIVEDRAKAKGSGYPYPGIYEFGVSGRDKKRRPFLEPALEKKQPEVMRSLEDLLDRLTSKNGFGRGGLL